MKEQVDLYKQTELELGMMPRPEIWEEHERWCQWIISDLEVLNDEYKKPQQYGFFAGDKLEAANEVYEDFMDGAENFYLLSENLLLKRQHELLKKAQNLLKEGHELLKENQELLKRNDPWENCRKAYEKFIQATDIKQWIKKETPAKVALLYRESHKAITEVYKQIRKTSQDIMQATQQIKEGFPDKARQMIDRSLERLADVLDKSVAYLKKRRDAILQLSPREAEKLRRQEPAMDRPGDKRVKKVVARRSPARGKEQGR